MEKWRSIDPMHARLLDEFAEVADMMGIAKDESLRRQAAHALAQEDRTVALLQTQARDQMIPFRRGKRPRWAGLPARESGEAVSLPDDHPGKDS